MDRIRKDDIETPALLIDLDSLEWNIGAMAAFFRNRKARLRPHFKTAKCPAICRLELAAGAVGITCAKVSEAEVLARAGIEDILVANQVVDTRKIQRLAGLAGEKTKITVCVDNPANVLDLSSAAQAAGVTLHVLVEMDVGMGRCGVGTPEEVLALAQAVSNAPGLIFEGIQAYEGHLSTLPDLGERQRGVARMIETVTAAKELLERNGIPVRTVSGGGTGTYEFTGGDTIWTEIQAGSYVLMDGIYRAGGAKFKQALTVLTTVIHKRPGVAVTDCGKKACSTDGGDPSVSGHPGLKAVLSEEHGIIKDGGDELAYEQKIEYVPAHCCTTVNLYDQYHCVRGGALECVWPIPGRGKSR